MVDIRIGRTTLLGALVAALIAVLGVTTAAHAATGPNYVAVTLTTRDMFGTVNALPRDVTVWLQNVDNEALTYQLGLLDQSRNVWWAVGVPDGRYRVSVGSSKYADTWWPGVYTKSAAGVAILKRSISGNCSGQVATTGCQSFVWEQQIQQARPLSGYVRNRQGAGVANVILTAVRVGEEASRFAVQTNASGYYSMALPPGSYTLVTTNGGTTASAAVTISGQGHTQDVTLQDAPSAPRDVTANPSSRQLNVTWAPPADNGGHPITGYHASVTAGGPSCTTSGDRPGCTITGLANNTAYRVSVVATNAVGSSPIGISNVATPSDPVPSAPRALQVIPAAGSATVAWSPPVAGADAVISYRVSSTPGGLSCTSKDLSCVVSGLTNGQAYTFRAVAISTGGESGVSDSSIPVTPADVPGPPLSVTANGATRALTASWAPPADHGGASVTGYTATAAPGGRSCTTDANTRQCTIDGLTKRAYTVSVTATNRIGVSQASASSNEVTPVDPSPAAPQDVRAIAGPQSVVISWEPPHVDADTVTGYKVTSSPGGFSCSTKDLTCTITGLTNGQPYTFRVTASSTGGQSTVSEPTMPVTPAGPPSPPRAVQADAGDRSVLVSWNAPHDDGGAAVKEYTATAWPGGRVCTTTADLRQCAIAGLTNGQSYTVTVTATNRVGTSERSPGAAQVTPSASKPNRTVSAGRVKLFKTKVSKGAVTVRWEAVGARKVRLTWKRLPKGTPDFTSTGPSGRMILKGPKGTRFRVGLVGTYAAGQKVSTERVFRIAK